MKRAEKAAQKKAWIKERKAAYIAKNKAAREAAERDRREKEAREARIAYHEAMKAREEKYRREAIEHDRLLLERQRLEEEREELLATKAGLSVPDYRRLMQARRDLLDVLKRRRQELQREEYRREDRPRVRSSMPGIMMLMVACALGGMRR